ncbi:hypothetical protein IJT93_05175 [bacterium]|nr:hypothetical protein [bacterium]
MVAPIGINTNAYSQVDNVRNMQQVGGQSQVTKKQDVEPQSTVQNPVTDGVHLSDDVTFTQDAQENATHVGLAQDQFEDGEEIGAAREDGAEIGGILGQEAPAEDESGTTVNNGVTTDENGFILLDDQGNVIGGSGPIEDDATPAAGGPNGPNDPNDPNGNGSVNNNPYARQPGESETDYTNRMKALEDDRQEAMKIWTQMQADRQKWLMELMKIISDARTATMEVFQSMIQNKAAAMDRINHNWDRIFHER